MVESYQKEIDPQTLDLDMKKFEEAVPQTIKSIQCDEHKLENYFVVKDTDSLENLKLMCPQCVVTH